MASRAFPYSFIFTNIFHGAGATMDDAKHTGTPASPIGQMLNQLGLTRTDLMRHSSTMRAFLTAENSNFSRVSDGEISEEPGSRPPSVYTSRSRASSFANASNTPPLPHTPVKPESGDSLIIHGAGSMDAVIERKSRLNRKEKRTRKERSALSPTPSHPSRAQSPDSSRSAQSSTSSQAPLHVSHFFMVYSCI